VSANNLHRDEAVRRSSLLDVGTTRVHLDFASAGTAEVFRSTAEIQFRCSEPGAETFLNLTAPTAHELVLNDVPLDVDAVFDGNRVTLANLAADNVLRVVAYCSYMRTGEGLHRFRDPVDDEIYLYSQFETFDAHRAYACFDQPDLKTVFSLSVTAPEHWQVVSNMAGEASPTTEGVRHWTFADTPRMSTYITAVVAGPYHSVFDNHPGRDGDIPLGLYCRRSLAQHLDHDELFTVTKQGFGFFEQAFDYPYPFGKYDQLFVPEFNAGAM